MLRVGLDYIAAREVGRPIAEAIALAVEGAGRALDPATRRALAEAAREELPGGAPAGDAPSD
jgi:hypothetical protein